MTLILTCILGHFLIFFSLEGRGWTKKTPDLMLSGDKLKMKLTFTNLTIWVLFEAHAAVALVELDRDLYSVKVHALDGEQEQQDITTGRCMWCCAFLELGQELWCQSGGLFCSGHGQARILPEAQWMLIHHWLVQGAWNILLLGICSISQTFVLPLVAKEMRLLV
jgi:hypothetical protein